MVAFMQVAVSILFYTASCVLSINLFQVLLSVHVHFYLIKDLSSLHTAYWVGHFGVYNAETVFAECPIV